MEYSSKELNFFTFLSRNAIIITYNLESPCKANMMSNFDYQKARYFLENKEKFRQKESKQRDFQSSFVKLAVLLSEIHNLLAIVKKIENFYEIFIQKDFDANEPKTSDAIVISNLICSYYTCFETIFLRISQFFENNLLQDKWHQDLLQKMTLNIPGLRPSVISDCTYHLLLELLKFRHFKRYYFALNYDWDKLEFVQKKYDQLKVQIYKELNDFLDYLDKLKPD